MPIHTNNPFALLDSLLDFSSSLSAITLWGIEFTVELEEEETVTETFYPGSKGADGGNSATLAMTGCAS